MMRMLNGPNPARRVTLLAILVATLPIVAGCGVLDRLAHRGPAAPAESEFGLGPRASSDGMYVVTLRPPEPLAKRKLQKVNVAVTDAEGRPVEDATIAVDGGMPAHGHGLPTRPRMTSRLGNGVYEIDGVRFNMGGWWEFKLTIAGAPGTDSVTFNLRI